MELRVCQRPYAARIPLLLLLLILVCPRPSLAMERIKISSTTADSPTNAGTLSPSASGSLIRSAHATTTWYLYPGACVDRANNTWSPRSTPQADSLDTYTAGGTGPYTIQNQSQQEILWHVVDSASSPAQRPPILSGTRMLWCGKYDPTWAGKLGYPNFTYQVLYIDTGAHAGDYSLSLDYQLSTELIYDDAYLIGGGAGATDPIGASRSILDAVIATGSSGSSTLLITWSGAITPLVSGASNADVTARPQVVRGNEYGAPATVSGASFLIAADHRALYLVLRTDCFHSNEDGLWPSGQGFLLDNLATSDNGSIYADQTPAGGVDSFGGNVIRGTPGAPILSARVPTAATAGWQLATGASLPTPDFCTPKFSGADLIFATGDGSHHTVPGEASTIQSCTFPLPSGISSVVARWSQYLDLPAYSGFVQFAEFRSYRDSTWTSWRNMDGGGARRVESNRAWGAAAADLADAVGADSVQLRYSFRCVPELTADGQTCASLLYGLLYDDFRLEVVTGASAPSFGIYPSFLAQSTFVDGTIPGNGCFPGTAAGGQCWPGLRGSDTGGFAPIHDNVNSPLGDSIVVSIRSGARRNGMGINWQHGFDPSVDGGRTMVHTNPNYVASFDKPRVIYRLFDPATKTWSPFDSSELDANSVLVAGTETTLVDARYRMNWPPRDRLGFSLPGGFTVNGKSLYVQLAFLPRGTRLQYYFKGVDIFGGTSYQFSSDVRAFEVTDLPTLPGSAVVAPDIIEFDVLPGVYSTAGTAGTLVAGRTNTPILNLDGAYGTWGSTGDAVTRALRAMGVRADRYRMLQGTEQGGNFGGHEQLGTRIGRLANYFPNMDEYGIRDSLASWYRILIESTHRRGSFSVLEESDARLLQSWWEAPTPGTDGGDRCVLLTGNDGFNALTSAGSVPHPNENALASQVFGVGSAPDEWNGNGNIHLPLIKDMFADPASGPGLGVSGAYTYPVDGGCPGPDRFDALFKVVSPEAQNAATYPTFAALTQAAAVSYATDRDVLVDHDRNKALGYGFSLQFIRQGTMGLVDTRAQVLYKFLTSCRGPRSVADTAFCWPCPADPNKYSNWAVSGGFQTGTYGPLYAIQNGNLAAAAVDPAPAPSFADALMQNRPNPFNPETVIPFSLSMAGRVAVRIYDVRGRLVRTVLDAVRPAGIHAARWNGSTETGERSASGVYFYVITYPDGQTSARKMTVLR